MSVSKPAIVVHALEKMRVVHRSVVVLEEAVAIHASKNATTEHHALKMSPVLPELKQLASVDKIPWKSLVMQHQSPVDQEGFGVQ